MTEQVTDVNQLTTSDGRLYSGHDCGLCCALGMALDAGLPRDETIPSMEQWYAAHGDTPADGTGCQINAAWLQSEGLPAATFNGGMDAVDTVLASGYRATLAIWSNSYGYPYSGSGKVGHFIEVCYRNPDGSYTVMQPVGGTTVSYARDLIQANSQNVGFMVKHDYRQTGVTTVPGTATGGYTFMDPTLIFRGLVQIIVRLTYGRAATQQEMDWWVQHAAALGAGGAEWELEEALAGDDVIGHDYAKTFAKLHQVASS